MRKFFSSKLFWITFVIFFILYSMNVMVNDRPVVSVIQTFVAALGLTLVTAIVVGGIIYIIMNIYKRRGPYNSK